MTRKQIDVDVAPGFYIVAACALLILPVRLVISWLIAAVIHEIAHILFLKNHIVGIRILPTGALLQTIPLTAAQECKAALIGPVASLLLCLLFRIFPLVAFCGFIQFIFNILPVYPLDGGRSLYCVIKHRFGQKTACITMRYISMLLFAVLLLFSAYAALAWRTMLPALYLCILIIRKVKGKIPCKYRGRGVQ